MNENKFDSIFSKTILRELFPPSRTVDFFEALFGDNEEGAYDIILGFQGYAPDARLLTFNLELHERKGKCLACNLTHGLPEVFSRHPIINIKDLVEDIEKQLGGEVRCGEWRLGTTRQQRRDLHVIPLMITIT